MARLYLALVHHPVLNRFGEIIASAITTIDLHDLGRLARTYEIPGCYIVTPLEDQINLAQRLISHWTERVGGQIHPNRVQALERLILVRSISEALDNISHREGLAPELWVSSARMRNPDKIISITEAREHLRSSNRYVLLLLGTAWGLATEVFEQAEHILEPICPNASYNHLSVRCAAAIIVDRLLGDVETREKMED